MCNLVSPKPSNWYLMPAWISLVFALVGLWIACSGTPPQVRLENPSDLCTSTLALSSAVKAQAAKLGLEPTELARRACDAAILATQVAEANLPKASGVAGAPNLASSPLMGLAGSGG